MAAMLVISSIATLSRAGWPDLSLTDLSGVTHEFRGNADGRVRAMVFLSTDCPIARSYTKALNRLAESLREDGRAELFGVVSDRATSRADAKRHFDEYRADFPVLFDASGLLAGALEPVAVPEAFVLDPQGVVRYRGAIDDAWGAIGRRRPRVSRRYLEEAIASVVRGETPEPASTKAVGCLFETPGAEEAAPKVTYYRDIAPILQARCEGCHRAGQVAPFALSTYEQAVKRSRLIEYVTHERLMPPWGPAAGAQPPLVGDRRLSDAEVALLSRWVADGSPRGDEADAPTPVEYADGWRLGEPDLVVEMPEAFSVPAEGPDVLQNFVLPLEVDGDKLVSAVEFLPGNPLVTHHAVLFLDESGVARRRDEATPEPGYESFGGPGFFPSGALGGWSVGNTPRHLPGGRGRYLKRGSDLLVQVHYHPSGRPETDRSKLGLHFVDKPIAESIAEPGRLVGSIWAANYQIDIPAGEPRYLRTARYTIPRDVSLVGVVPHMHLLGRSITAVAQLPSGKVRPLIEVPRWDFQWQDEYYYQQPIALPKGTTLVVTAQFDNSADNPQQPRDPPQRVTWGEGTEDEMMYCFFLLSAEKVEDLVAVVLDNLAHDVRQPRPVP